MNDYGDFEMMKLYKIEEEDGIIYNYPIKKRGSTPFTAVFIYEDEWNFYPMKPTFIDKKEETISENDMPDKRGFISTLFFNGPILSKEMRKS